MNTRWSEEEDEYLLANYRQSDLPFLSKMLSRSESAVKSRYYSIVGAEKPQELMFFMSRANRVKPKRLRRIKKGQEPGPSKAKKGSAYSHTRTGYRPDLDLVCRSGWEANIMRVLKSYDIPFDFEPTTFYFPIKRGTKAYIPDIYLSATTEFIEVKGYFDKKSEIKIRRFKKYYPEDFATLTIIIGKSSKKARDTCESLGIPNILFYEEIKKIFRPRINNWEGK